MPGPAAQRKMVVWRGGGRTWPYALKGIRKEADSCIRPHYSSHCFAIVYPASSPGQLRHANAVRHGQKPVRVIPQAFPQRLCGRRGRLKFQQTARGALQDSVPLQPVSKTVLVQAGPQTARGLIGGRVDAVLPQQIGQRRAGHALGVQQVPRRRRDRLPASVSYCL